MKNRFGNLILKTAIVLWAAFIILILVSFVKFETPNSKLQTDKLDQIKPLIENNIHNLTQEIENESLQPIATPTPEPTAPEYFYYLSNYERWLVESIVAGEAGSEPYWGKVGVASCILNACFKDDIRPEEVQTKYQYSGFQPIEEFESECFEVYGNTDLADEVREAVEQVFDRGEVLSDDILFFYAPKYSSGTWHQTQQFVVEVGGHRFYSPWDKIALDK